MKSLELVEFKFYGRLFLFLMLVLPISSGQPVADYASTENNEGAKAFYDQRQSGKYNIRINIKDVTILEMDSNDLGDDPSSEEDYYYDEDDLTVKPLKLTTPSHLSNTSVSMQSIPTSTQSNEEESSTVDPTNHTIPTNSNTIVNSDSQEKQIASMQTTRPTNASYRQAEPLASLVSLAIKPYSNNVPLPNLKSPMSIKLNQTVTEPVTAPSITITSGPSFQPEQNPSQNNKESRSDIGNKHSFQFGKSNYLTRNHVRRCRANRYLDRAGNCRTIHSTSFLKKLFSAIATLPFSAAKEPYIE